jgi:cellulose synthase/poly-beta-1,6-N-acetylglucosamine synthase-like glycosyltransferase
MGDQRSEHPKTLKEEFLSKLRFASFHFSAALFFFFMSFIAFLMGLSQPQNTLVFLIFLLSLLPTVLTLTSSTLLKTLEDKKSQKRLAASVLFVAISFPGSWLLGVIASPVYQMIVSPTLQDQGKSLLDLIFGSIATLVYGLFLIFPYRASASHLVGILLDVAREGGLFEDTTQATPQEKA